MLAIRLQRTGRKGHAQFRMVVQDSRRTPTSGRFVALLGSYNPHSKTLSIDKEKAELYLKNGARPSDRVARLLKAEGVKLPSWVTEPTKQERAVRNPEKRRSTAPEKPAEPEAKPEPEAEAVAPVETEVVAEPAAEVPAEEAPAEEATPAEEAVSEETPSEETQIEADPEAEAAEEEA